MVLAASIAVVSGLGCSQEAGEGRLEAQIIKIGCMAPLTGSGAKYGDSARRGIELARGEINAGGGVRGRNVQVVYEDSQGDPRRAVDAFRKLVSVDRVPAVIGDLFSSATLAVAPIANDNQVVLLSPTSSTPEITDAGPYVFRNVASDVFEGSVMAEFTADKLHMSEVAVLYINNAYGVGIRDVFTNAFRERGGEIVAEEAFPEGSTDFRAQLTKIRTRRPQAVYIVGYRELGPLLKQAYELGLRVQYLSTVMFEDPEILQVAGQAAEGVIYSARAYDPESEFPATERFVAAFEERYGGLPDIFAALSYDAMRLLSVAMDHRGFAPSDIRAGLLEIQDYPGAAGLTSFDENGDVIQAALIKTVKGGQFVLYGTDES